MTIPYRSFVLALIIASVPLSFHGQEKPVVSDIPAKFTAPQSDYDYTKRVEMIPMRDGVKLYTVIVVPKAATHAPILLTRTPYNAAARATRMESPRMLDELPKSDEVFVRAGYIRVWTKSLARRTLLQWLSAGIVGCVSLGSQEVYRDPSSAADAG